MIILIILSVFGVFLLIPFIHGFFEGLTGKNHTEIIEDIEACETDQNAIEAIDEEIAMLEISIERRKEAACILEKDLKYTTNESKRVTLLNKLNTLDKQTFKDVQRIEKLRSGI